MSDDKMALWNRVCKTDPKYVKKITGKDYGGNSPSPYYIVRRLTEEFGPAGLGWGFDIVDERMERLGPDDVLHIARITFWYKTGNCIDKQFIQQVGQTKACYRTKGESGYLKVDEDAPKKSITDALVKCASYLGFAGDIFSGRWDDSKYVAGLAREFAEAAKDAAPKIEVPMIAPAKIAAEMVAKNITEERKGELEDCALTMLDAHTTGNDSAAIELYYGLPDNEEKIFVWNLLAAESALRRIIKANSPAKTA